MAGNIQDSSTVLTGWAGTKVKTGRAGTVKKLEL